MSQATLGSTPYQNSNLFSGYYLDERIADLDRWDCDDDAEKAFDDLKTLWDLEGSLVDSYKEDELLDEWIDKVVEVLGFGTKSEATLPNSGGYNDRLLFNSPEERRDAAERVSNGEADADYKLASAVLEAKQWGADFTERFSEARSYRDASHQIKYYLEHTPETLNWGVLTDGKKWRLYGTKDYATEIYYEVDLPELLSTGTLEQFKYFYAFFRPEAFREVGGTSFLDTVWNESETAAQELGEDLQDNVFTALRVLGEGFVHQNDLDIDPDDEAARGELKEQSLVLLYRLMFVLYAESRGLIRPDDEDARDEYEEHFSLDELRAEIHEAIQEGDTYDDYSGYSTKMWSQLQDLFELVDEGNEELDIPPYNGGLFDDDEHEFLANHEVADRHIAEVIHRLGTTVDDDGEYVLADYADLDTRHLGSIYEGLLEHEFRIAGEQYAAVSEDGGQVWKPATEVSVADAVETVEAGELYVVNDDGERKATGAYYTPDYVVSYIVEETVDPLLDDIKADLAADGLEPSEPEYFRRFWQSVLDLKVLDPAMGSAHFLTSATGYLTEQVMEVVREQEIQGYDEQHLRREIAKECIYGVDVNGMAVELGKLSMWLETLAADQPLAFLDHHLKAGNSLVGSDITEVLSDDVDDDGGQLTLMQVAARARKDTLEHVMELMQELLAIDNETLDDIKSMEELYDEIRDDPLYQRLFEIANVHTAEEFGLDVPEGVYEEMAGAIEDEAEWDEIRGEDWFASAQAMADEEDFFHWELEYPEVFFGEDGEKREDAGFDAVVGNPPYVRMEQFKGLKRYLNRTYESHAARTDLYVYFIERSTGILREAGEFGMIISNKFLRANYGRGIRKYVDKNTSVRQIIDFGGLPVFPDATVRSAILLARDGENLANSPSYAPVPDLDFQSLSEVMASVFS
ncbi:Eco57I restriction-modification methylase domain-containing protein [Halobacterium salinarum]|nr:N-6 DNA methylase [Halobacterium salinarum]MDL0137062.1 Eco57I restriction-modification methylase domain-containing protein [Halobacterium salinarum]MDL0140116.1 Eco57I restriction-modification methylase domain-containing protein [Halobacterium salinarum]